MKNDLQWGRLTWNDSGTPTAGIRGPHWRMSTYTRRSVWAYRLGNFRKKRLCEAASGRGDEGDPVASRLPDLGLRPPAEGTPTNTGVFRGTCEARVAVPAGYQ